MVENDDNHDDKNYNDDANDDDSIQFGPMLASSLHSGHNVYSYSQVAICQLTINDDHHQLGDYDTISSLP